MKAILSVVLGGAVLGLTHIACAAVMSINEYPDKIVAEIDGSMDPKSAVQAIDYKPNAQAGAPELQQLPSVQEKAASRIIPAVPNEVAEKYYGKPYNRAQQVMEYLSKIPNRNDFVEKRLEARQARWTKRNARTEFFVNK
jgi:hypothetical protein